MQRPRLSLKPALLAGTFLAAFLPGALAQDANAVGERLKALLALQGTELSYSAARSDGDDVTLEGVTIKNAAADEALPLGDMTLEDVSEESDGSYRVGTVALDEFQHQAEGVTVSMTDFVISGLLLSPETADPYAGAMRYERMEIGRVDVEGEDGPLASLANLWGEMSEGEGGVLNGSGGAESFSFNLATVASDGGGESVVEELGYSEITGRVSMEGSWQPSDGRVILSRYQTVIDDAGTLDLSIDLSGYTPQFIRTMDEMRKRMEAAENKNDPMQGMAMFGLMQQLTFHGLGLRFTDDSLTEKALDYLAEQQGSTPADLITQVRTIIPLQISPFVGQELANNIANAVGSFLESPDNIEISAKPASPLPFSSFMAVMSEPEKLVRQLQLSVTANQ